MFFGFEWRDGIVAGVVIASEAKQSIAPRVEEWIASSLALPCTNASRLSQAMTWMQYRDYSAKFNDAGGNGFPPAGIRGRLLIHLRTKLIDRLGCSFGVGCQEHVRGIEPIHLAARLRGYDLVHLPPVHQVVKTPMQTQHGACDLSQSIALVDAKRFAGTKLKDLSRQGR